MVLGIVWCALEKSREIAERIREIKNKHGMSPTFEMKWSKISPSGISYYLDIIDYFFDNPHLHFRGLVANKLRLSHESFHQSHNDWYHKMYYVALQTVLAPKSKYRIYFDIKDTKSGPSLRLLHDVLCNKLYDFDHRVIERVQAVHSNHVEQVQLADLFAGALSYANRNLSTSTAKSALVERIRKRSGYTLLRNTLFREEKLNIFHWDPQGDK